MKIRWKIVIAVIVAVIYTGSMIYISMIQKDYAVSIKASQSEYEFGAELSEYVIPVVVENRANRMLVSTDDQRCFLSYHVYDEDGTLLAYDNRRTEFINRIFSGKSAEEEIRITGLEPGEYQIVLDVVKEGVAWFSENGADCDTIRLMVQ